MNFELAPFHPDLTLVELVSSNNFEALTSAKALIERCLATLRDEQIARLRQHVLEQTALLGLTPAGLFEAKCTPVTAEVSKSASLRANGVPQYRDPNSTATWTGKGKPPLWMKAHLDAGGSKEDLRIKRSDSDEVARVEDALS